MRSAEQPVTQLHQDIKTLHTEIVELRKALATTTHTLAELRVAQLLKANEYLAGEALRSDRLADTAKSDLAELTRTSQRDVLTNTVNRTVMLERVKHAIAMAQRNGGRMAVLFLDLDDFKHINDEMGHATGDEVLKHTARCMESVLRDTDTVSRHGGDEFLVLLAGIAQASDAAQVSTKILKALALPCKLGGHTFRLSASLGVAIYPEDGREAGKLIDHADSAMYLSKKHGPGCFAFHTTDHKNAGKHAEKMPPAPSHLSDLAKNARATEIQEKSGKNISK